jgi:hypothetical protein
MTDFPQEERLKSDQLRSLTECEQAIYSIAKKTGKSPLDIWRVNETWLSEKASKVDWDVECNWRRFCVPNLMMLGFLLYQLCGPDWRHTVVGVVVFIVLVNIMIFIYDCRPNWILLYGRCLRAWAGSLFSFSLALVGYDWVRGVLKYDLVLWLLGIVLAFYSVKLLNLYPELVWNHFAKEWERRKKQLVILRMVRPVLGDIEDHSSGSAVDRSSVASCVRLRGIVDWD